MFEDYDAYIWAAYGITAVLMGWLAHRAHKALSEARKRHEATR